MWLNQNERQWNSVEFHIEFIYFFMRRSFVPSFTLIFSVLYKNQTVNYSFIHALFYMLNQRKTNHPFIWYLNEEKKTQRKESVRFLVYFGGDWYFNVIDKLRIFYRRLKLSKYNWTVCER